MATEATRVRVGSPSYQAYQILHIAFTVAPIVAGADKFFHFLVNWDMYLSPIIPRMLGVGVIEMIAGVLCAVVPRIGGLITGLWLLGIIVNLLSIPAYYDIALRDLGLALGAFALSRLAVDYSA